MFYYALVGPVQSGVKSRDEQREESLSGVHTEKKKEISQTRSLAIAA
jgi:hypothetical protein